MSRHDAFGLISGPLVYMIIAFRSLLKVGSDMHSVALMFSVFSISILFLRMFCCSLLLDEIMTIYSVRDIMIKAPTLC